MLPLIVKSVPSPSIFSPSSPKVNPTLAGTFISVVAVKLISAPAFIVKSVPSDSIFSAESVKCKPTFDGMITSVSAVSLMLLPFISKSVPSPSIFSPSLPKVNPTPDGILMSVVAVRFMSCPDAIVKSVPSPNRYSPPASNRYALCLVNVWWNEPVPEPDIFPITSNASAGAVSLIPILLAK